MKYFLLAWENYQEAGLADHFSQKEKYKDDGRNDKPNLTRLVLSDRVGPDSTCLVSDQIFEFRPPLRTHPVCSLSGFLGRAGLA